MSVLYVSRGRTVVISNGVTLGQGELITTLNDEEAARFTRLGIVQDTPPNIPPPAVPNPANIGLQNNGDVQGPRW
jgi:hypothetical protein